MEGERRMCCVHYVEALMENFPAGERVLMKLVPKVMNFFSKVIVDTATDILNNISAASLELLTTPMKVFMNFLHNSSPILALLIRSHDHKSHDSSEGSVNSVISSVASLSCEEKVCISELHWPELDMREDESKEEWMYTLLQSLGKTIEQLLIRGDSLPRDAVTTAAMLNVVLVTVQYGSSLCVGVQLLCVNKFTSGSCIPLLSQLCLSHSLLAKLTSQDLLTITIDDVPLLLWLFPVTCTLFDSFTETPDRYTASRTLCTWTIAAKDCVMCEGVSVMVEEALSPTGHLVQKLLRYIWLLWEDPVESVRHQCRAMFNNIILMVKSLSPSAGQSEGKDFLSSLCHSLLSLPGPARGKYVLLRSLVPHLSVGGVLEVWPQLPAELMSAMGHQLLACRAGELWSRMVSQHYSELEKEGEEEGARWQTTWVDPLVSTLMQGAPLARQHIVQHCLASIFTTCPQAMDMCNTSIQRLSCDASASLTATFACLRCAISSQPCHSLVEEHFDTISTAVHHSDEQVCSSVFALLCESKKSTDPPQDRHLRLVLEGVRVHMGTQSPGFRYQLLTALKKLLSRICDSSYSLKKLKSKGKAPSDVDQILIYTQEFLQTLTLRCFEVLHPLSTFQRRHFALSILQLMSTIFNGTELDESIAELAFSNSVSLAQGRLLVHTLWDTFDSNRALAVQLLLTLPINKTGLQDKEFLEQAITSCHQLMVSPKAVNCVTAYNLTKLLTNLAPEAFSHQLSHHICDSPSPVPSVLLSSPPPFLAQLSVVWILLGTLRGHVTLAKADLLTASITAPMYGVLQAIRAALETMLIRTLPADAIPSARELIAYVITSCAEVAAIVAPTVCNSSPEGFLPAGGFKYATEGEVEEKEYCVDDGEVSGGIHGNAQSLLLCCWHCTKELVSLLKLVVEEARLRAAALGQETILTSDQLEVISSLLLQLLTEARHRGAFEIAYVGFTALCQYLWSSPDPLLHCRPSKWMKELLSSFSHSSSLTQLLSITRRSAGLPFYVQAILITEPVTNSRACLKHAVTSLLSIASSHDKTLSSSSSSSSTGSSSSLTPLPAAVHALNILRALYRESKLGEVMVSFVAEGVIIAVRGFSSASWAVRNSSTLLLSALVMRIFGVKKVQEEHSVENKMAAQEFFSRFPSLHQFLLSKLTTAMEGDQQPESLFPVLLLLSRLKPSLQLKKNSSYPLTPFLSPLISLANCSVWKCRVLAAQSLVAILTPESTPSLLLSLPVKMSSAHQNQLHGLLLIVVHVLKESPWLAGKEETSVMKRLFESLLEKNSLGTSYNSCSSTRGLYLHCVSVILVHLAPTSPSSQATESLISLAVDCQKSLLIEGGRERGSVEHVDSDLAERQFQYLTTLESAVQLSGALCSHLLSCHQLSTQLLTHSLTPPTSVFEFVQQAVRRNSIEEEKVVEMTRNVAKMATEGDKRAYQLLCDILELECRSVSPMIDTLVQVFTAAVSALHAGYMREELMIAMLRFIQQSLKIVIHHKVIQKLLCPLLELLMSWCDETHPDPVRVAIAGLLGRNWNIWCETAGSSKLSTLFWQMSVALLQDVEEEVREEMCTSLQGMLDTLSSHTRSPGGRPVKSPLCQQATLRALMSSITHLYQTKPESGVSILLSLTTIATATQASKQDHISQLLFDEDKTHSFAEPVELLQYIAEEMKILLPLISEKRDLLEQLRTDSSSFQDDLHGAGGNSLFGNPWMNTTQFTGAVKEMLLANTLEEEEDSASMLRRTVTKHHDSAHPLLARLAKRCAV